MKAFESSEIWLVTGSQDLYGESVVEQVAEHSRIIAKAFDDDPKIPVSVSWKPVVTTSDGIRKLMLEANMAEGCIGVVAWMHTFSPAKMWIAGLQGLQKPMAHLHTQFNEDLPWATIDMDFMNLHQSAHGDREFGYIATRLRLLRTVIAGHWESSDVRERVGRWARAATGVHDAKRLRVARFGDNMRDVAVTEGDKVEVQAQMGPSVNTYAVNELSKSAVAIRDESVTALTNEYVDQYAVVEELQPGGIRHESLRDAARMELGIREFLGRHDCRAFTDTFEDLGDLPHLPGIAVQRLMAEGFGFGAEGDWKTAVLVRILKTMSRGLAGGTSFMEDYTYHLKPDGAVVLGAHMLEVCPSISTDQPRCEIHPLAIGGKPDPVRLVFDAVPGPAVIVGLADLGDRLRLVANSVEVVEAPHRLERLPVARAVWKPDPDLPTAAEAWILAGGPHHTAFSQALDLADLETLSEMLGVELVAIDSDTSLSAFKKELRWSAAHYRLSGSV